MKKSPRFEPMMVAAAAARHFPRHLERPFFRMYRDDPSELIWSVQDFDDFYLTARDKACYTRDFRSLLESFQPDVVHIQHTLRLGFEVLTEIRKTCPSTPILYTLHEFLPICHARGIMLRRGSGERCAEASPWRCHQCFPEVSPEDFVRRERFVKSQFEHVDLFLAPSRFLMSQYISWGIPEERIQFHEYGRRVVPPLPIDDVDTRRFVFLGQAMRHKGVLVLLRAMKRLVDQGRDDVILYIDGANMDFDGDAYIEEVQRELRECEGQVVLRGSYAPDEIPDKLHDAGWVVVPSIWWENSPLVIQEAFMYGRPVLCSNIGGMAEKVAHGKNGLHFRAGDDAHLAEVIDKVAGDDELWQRLRDGIRPVYSLEEALSDLEMIYHDLSGRKAPVTIG